MDDNKKIIDWFIGYFNIKFMLAITNLRWFYKTIHNTINQFLHKLTHWPDKK